MIFANSLTTLRYKLGDVILGKGEMPKCLFIIHKGSVNLIIKKVGKRRAIPTKSARRLKK